MMKLLVMTMLWMLNFQYVHHASAASTFEWDLFDAFLESEGGRAHGMDLIFVEVSHFLGSFTLLALHVTID